MEKNALKFVTLFFLLEKDKIDCLKSLKVNFTFVSNEAEALVSFKLIYRLLKVYFQ